MAAPFHFSLLSPRGKAVEGDVESVVLPGADGDLGVLAGHAPLICALRRGIAQVTRDGRTEFFVTGEGVLEVSLSGVHALVDTAEAATSLEQAREFMKTHLAETGDLKPAGKA